LNWKGSCDSNNQYIWGQGSPNINFRSTKFGGQMHQREPGPLMGKLIY